MLLSDCSPSGASGCHVLPLHMCLFQIPEELSVPIWVMWEGQDRKPTAFATQDGTAQSQAPPVPRTEPTGAYQGILSK